MGEVSSANVQAVLGRVAHPTLPELPWASWWGLPQLFLGVLSVLAVAGVGFDLGLDLADPEAAQTYDETGTSDGVLQVVSVAAFQVGLFTWPFVVTGLWKGRGPQADWGLRLSWVDVPVGFVVGVLALFLAAMVRQVMAWLVRLNDVSEAGNTAPLENAEGTIWFYFLIGLVTIGAPISEELFYRGFVLRTFSRFGGRIVGVVVSSVLFALPHSNGAALDATIVLLTTVGAAGVLFAVVALVTNRLGPAITAHITFNSIVTAALFLL